MVAFKWTTMVDHDARKLIRNEKKQKCCYFYSQNAMAKFHLGKKLRSFSIKENACYSKDNWKVFAFLFLCVCIGVLMSFFPIFLSDIHKIQLMFMNTTVFFFFIHLALLTLIQRSFPLKRYFVIFEADIYITKTHWSNIYFIIFLYSFSPFHVLFFFIVQSLTKWLSTIDCGCFAQVKCKHHQHRAEKSCRIRDCLFENVVRTKEKNKTFWNSLKEMASKTKIEEKSKNFVMKKFLIRS